MVLGLEMEGIIIKVVKEEQERKLKRVPFI